MGTRHVAYVSDVSMKLRLSRQLAIDQFFGPGDFDPLEEEWHLPIVDTTTSATMSLRLAHALKDEEKVHIQLAMLYTLSIPRQSGAQSVRRRCLRVHNLSLLASDKHTVIYRNSDIEAVVGALAKMAAAKAKAANLVNLCLRKGFQRSIIGGEDALG